MPEIIIFHVHVAAVQLGNCPLFLSFSCFFSKVCQIVEGHESSELYSMTLADATVERGSQVLRRYIYCRRKAQCKKFATNNGVHRPGNMLMSPCSGTTRATGGNIVFSIVVALIQPIFSQATVGRLKDILKTKTAKVEKHRQCSRKLICLTKNGQILTKNLENPP